MRKAFLAAVVLIGLLGAQANAEIQRTKDGEWYTVVDLFNNQFSYYEQSQAVIRTLADLDWQVTDVQKDKILANFDDKQQLRIDFGNELMRLSEVPSSFVFEREWLPKLEAGIIRELKYIRNMRKAAEYK